MDGLTTEMAPIQVVFRGFPAVFDLVMVVSAQLKDLVTGGHPLKVQKCAPSAGDWHTIKATLAETTTLRRMGSVFDVSKIKCVKFI